MLQLTLVLAGFLLPAATTAQEALFLIRHAEKAEGDNPPLTDAGRARAHRWAEMLAETNISKVFTSTARRTMETGGIIADTLGIDAEALPPNDTTALLDQIAFDHEDDRILIVGHNETIPAILTTLGMFDQVEMSDTEFGRLFVVFPGEDEPTVLDMRMPDGPQHTGTTADSTLLTLSGPDQSLTVDIAEADTIFMHGEPSLQFALTEASSKAMADLTGAMIGQPLTVSLCNIDLVEAVVRERISGRGLINMPSIEAAIAATEVLKGDATCEALAPHFPD